MAAVAQKNVVESALVQPFVTPKLAKLLVEARYSAPSVVSFPLRGVMSTGQVSMIGNT